MKKQKLKYVKLILFFLLSSKVCAYTIESSSRAMTYEMKTCIQGQKVEGCRGIILKDVVLKGMFGSRKKVDHLFFRNMRGSEGPVSEKCLEAYVSKINKYIQHPSIMESFSRRPRGLWSDPEDGSQFSFPTQFKHTKIDDNGSAYALPILSDPEFRFKDEEAGLDCSFSLSMSDHTDDLDQLRESVGKESLEEIKIDEQQDVEHSDALILAKDDQGEVIEDNETIIEEQSECIQELEGPLAREARSNIDQLDQIARKVYERDIIMSGDLSYGAFGMDAAKANIFLETYGDEISSISLQANFDIFGMSGSVAETVFASDLTSGREVGFAAEPGLKPILKVVPGEDFTKKDGGSLRFEFWDGNNYKVVNSQLKRDSSGEFKVYIVKNGRSNEVNYLSANVRGFSASGMRVHHYEVSSK